MSALLTSLLLLTSAAQEPSEPRPLEPVAGMAGFASVSRVEFAGENPTPHRLEAVYLFPDRARWRLLPLAGRATERQLVYRLGPTAFELGPGQTRSTVFEESSLETAVLQLELRRAAMLWPDGFAWEPAAGLGEPGEPVRFAPVAILAPGAGEEPRRIGTLRARLDPRERPRQLEALDLVGKEIETLAVEAWQELQGRAWPHRLTLTKNGRPVWRETVEDVRTHVYFIDAFFQPPDRRPQPASAGEGGWSVLTLDLQGITYRLRELEEGLSWEDALVRAETLRQAAADEVGHELDPVPTLRLDPQGRPTGVFLRLATRVDPPPAGWTTTGDRPGLALVLAVGEPPSPRPLEALAGAVPAEARPGTAYARVVAHPRGEQQVQLYLPLEAPEGR